MHVEVDDSLPHQSERLSRAPALLLPRTSLATILPLLLSFTLGFAVVLVVGVNAHKFQLARKFSVLLPAAEDPFPNAIPVMQPGVVLHVSHDDSLNPERERDWVYLSWIKLKKSISPDERVVVSAKYDPSTKLRVGYSLVLRGGVDGVRPVVYWQGETGVGKWYTFAPMQLQSREWYLLAISFRRGTLGMHLTSASSPKSLTPLGGYEVGEEVLPVNSTELIAGSFANGKFRGRLGPIGIVTGGDISKDLPSFLKSIAKKPTELPEAPEGSNLVLWTDGKEDFGVNKLSVSVTLPGGKEFSRGEREERRVGANPSHEKRS